MKPVNHAQAHTDLMTLGQRRQLGLIVLFWCMARRSYPEFLQEPPDQQTTIQFEQTILKSLIDQMTETCGYMAQELMINSQRHFGYHGSMYTNLGFAQMCSQYLSAHEP